MTAASAGWCAHGTGRRTVLPHGGATVGATRGAEGLRRASEAPLRWLTLEIPPPAHTRARFGPVTAIHAGEVDGSQPVSWTLPVTSLHQAREVVRRVEVANRGLGSSSARWRRSRTGIERAVAINAVIAWRIAALLARTEPELPSTTAFTDLALLKDFAHVRKLPPPEDLGQAFRLVATMGGYLNRSKDGPPGDHLERSGCAVVHGVDAWPQCRCRGRQRRAATHQLARRHLWVMGRPRGVLWKKLRRHGKKPNWKGGCHSGRVDISERPAEAKERIGDWEPSSAKLTVELSCRSCHEIRLAGWTERHGRYDPPARLRCAIGPHNHVRQRSSQTTGVSHLTQISSSPFHSWERGLNEHTNGLVREYFPKGTDFRAICNEDVQKVQDRLNTRKVLGSPTEVILK